MSNKFLRDDTNRHSKLGKNRRKLQKWRRPRGRQSKMRKKRFSYPVMPCAGYGSPKKESGLINGKKPILINNVQDLTNVEKNFVLIISRRIGAKKKMDIIKKAQERNMQILNLGGKK